MDGKCALTIHSIHGGIVSQTGRWQTTICHWNIWLNSNLKEYNVEMVASENRNESVFARLFHWEDSNHSKITIAIGMQ